MYRDVSMRDICTPPPESLGADISYAHVRYEIGSLKVNMLDTATFTKCAAIVHVVRSSLLRLIVRQPRSSASFLIDVVQTGVDFVFIDTRGTR